MEGRNLRILSGEGSGREVIRLIHDQLTDLEEYKASVMLTTMAAAARFDVSPGELLEELVEGAPGPGAEWDDLKADIETMMAGVEAPPTEETE